MYINNIFIVGGVLEVCGECYNMGKLIDLLFLFCLPLLSILFLKTKRNELARPVMGTIFLVINEASKFPLLQIVRVSFFIKFFTLYQIVNYFDTVNKKKKDIC